MTADTATLQPSRGERRKARTRQALVDAARRLLVSRGTTDVSIEEITSEADVGFGSFYNHFTSKGELFEVAVAEALEEYGAMLDSASTGLEDPAEVYAVGVRMTTRLAATHPAIAQILAQVGYAYVISDSGLAPRAMRDIERGVEAGRFAPVSTPYLAFVATAGCVLAFLQERLARPDRLGDAEADDLAESLLRMLGMTASTARSVAHRPLPALDDRG